MPARRIKTLAAAKAKGLPQRLHREHRSKKGREKNYKWRKNNPIIEKKQKRDDADLKRYHENIIDLFKTKGKWYNENKGQ